MINFNNNSNNFNNEAQFDILQFFIPKSIDLKDIEKNIFTVVYSIKDVKDLSIQNLSNNFYEDIAIDMQLILNENDIHKSSCIVVNNDENLNAVNKFNKFVTNLLKKYLSMYSNNLVKIKKVDFFGLREINIVDFELLLNSKKIKSDINLYYVNNNGSFSTPMPYLSNFNINFCLDPFLIKHLALLKESNVEGLKEIQSLNLKDKDFLKVSKEVFPILLQNTYLEGFLTSRFFYLFSVFSSLVLFENYAYEMNTVYNYDIFNFEMQTEFSLKINEKTVFFILSTKVDKKTLKNILKIEAKIDNKIFKLNNKNFEFDLNLLMNFLTKVFEIEVTELKVFSDKTSFCKLKNIRDYRIFFKNSKKKDVISVFYNPFNSFYISLDGYSFLEFNAVSVLKTEAILAIIQGYIVSIIEEIEKKEVKN